MVKKWYRSWQYSANKVQQISLARSCHVQITSCSDSLAYTPGKAIPAYLTQSRPRSITHPLLTLPSFVFRKAKILINGVVEDAGGATNMPVGKVTWGPANLWLFCFQTAVEPGQNMMEVMIPAAKVGLVIGILCTHDWRTSRYVLGHWVHTCSVCIFPQERVVKW